MIRHIRATAPTRMCDCGGWTDTWFARTGRVFHVAIQPGVMVDVTVRPRNDGEDAATIEPVNLGPAYAFTPAGRRWHSHPLIEAAIESVPLPAGLHATVRVSSEMPPGASVGTSASVTVALLGALRMAVGSSVAPGEVAAAAHAIETEWLGQQSGVQDQLAAAWGGMNLVEIDAYPHAVVRPVRPAAGLVDELQRRFLLVVTGQGHRSTDIHEQVIREVSEIGPDHQALAALRHTATGAAAAVAAGRLDLLGRAMIDATEAQRMLHPALIGADAQRVIDLAASHGALGWKVNGAGGDCGSLTILCGDDATRRASLVSAIATTPACRVVPVRHSPAGLCVCDVECQSA